MGDKKRPHILPPLTPGSPAALPIPQADRGGQQPLPKPLAVMKNGERDRATDGGYSEHLASKLKLPPLAVRKTTTGSTETTRANTLKALVVRKPPMLTQRPHKGK